VAQFPNFSPEVKKVFLRLDKMLSEKENLVAI